MSAEQKKAVIREFNLKKGILVATFSGVMSACFSYGLRAGDPIKAIHAQARHRHALAGPARAGARVVRRLHHEFHLVLR